MPGPRFERNADMGQETRGTLRWGSGWWSVAVEEDGASCRTRDDGTGVASSAAVNGAPGRPWEVHARTRRTT